MPQGSLILGCDLAPIKPIPRVITFQSDITTDKCRATIRQHFKTWKCDTVLHDGAPNVGTAWVQDSFNQAELALQAMKLATEFLVEGGTFVTKVFRSKDYNSLLWVLNQLFTKVEATKPPSSRNVSAEIFVVCRGYKAPKKIDPRFLDPRSVFAELAGATPNNEAKVYNPEVKKRKRDGYEEGDYILYKEITASEFIQTADPIAILGQYNKLTFKQQADGDVTLAAIDKLPETTPEIRNCCADLKTLGRKDFKLLLKWRLKLRAIFGFAAKTDEAEPEATEEVAEVEPMDEELRMQEEIQAMKDKEGTKRKRERRRENEKKQREIVRMQLNMVAPMDIGMEESGPIGEGSMFSLKKIDRSDALRRLNKGKMIATQAEKKEKEKDSGLGSSGETDDEVDSDGDALEGELDSMYNNYQERKSEADAKYRAKKARQEYKDRDEEWEGLSADEKEDDSSDLEEEDDSDSDEDEEDLVPNGLIKDLDNTTGENGLSRKATAFFNQDLFKGIVDALPKPTDAEKNMGTKDILPVREKSQKNKESTSLDSDSEVDDKSGLFEMVKGTKDESDDWYKDEKRGDGRPGMLPVTTRNRHKLTESLDIDIITAEAMTLAHQLATGQKTTHDAIDDGFNKRAFRDRDGLPDWFIDDEGKHDKPHKPISKAAAKAIQEKMRAYNARPIKKVREAKARKKFKAAQKFEKLKKKSDMLAADEGMTEKEKSDSIARLLSRASKNKKPAPAKLVVARGVHRGVKGRPQGIKGRYRIVDPRMKKELRAQKRVAAKKKR